MDLGYGDSCVEDSVGEALRARRCCWCLLGCSRSSLCSSVSEIRTGFRVVRTMFIVIDVMFCDINWIFFDCIDRTMVQFMFHEFKVRVFLVLLHALV